MTKSVNKGLAKEGMGVILDAAKAALEGVDKWTAESIDAALEPLPEQMDLKKRVVFQAVRVAVCGNMVSPRWARPWRSSAATTAWHASTAPARWRYSRRVNACIRALPPSGALVSVPMSGLLGQNNQ